MRARRDTAAIRSNADFLLWSVVKCAAAARDCRATIHVRWLAPIGARLCEMACADRRRHAQWRTLSLTGVARVVYLAVEMVGTTAEDC